MPWPCKNILQICTLAFLSWSFCKCAYSHRPSDSSPKARPHRTGDLVDNEPSIPAQAVSGSGTYVAITRDLTTGNNFMQTGPSIHDAITASLTTCRYFSSEIEGQCTTMGVYSTRLSATLSGDIPNSWDCFARENPITGDIDRPRYWLNTGKTIEEAKQKVLKMCEIEGGVGCSLDRCYNGGRDKIR